MFSRMVRVDTDNADHLAFRSDDRALRIVGRVMIAVPLIALTAVAILQSTGDLPIRVPLSTQDWLFDGMVALGVAALSSVIIAWGIALAFMRKELVLDRSARQVRWRMRLRERTPWSEDALDDYREVAVRKEVRREGRYMQACQVVYLLGEDKAFEVQGFRPPQDPLPLAREVSGFLGFPLLHIPEHPVLPSRDTVNPARPRV